MVLYRQKREAGGMPTLGIYPNPLGDSPAVPGRQRKFGCIVHFRLNATVQLQCISESFSDYDAEVEVT
jgi:hypothetical protein